MDVGLSLKSLLLVVVSAGAVTTASAQRTSTAGGEVASRPFRPGERLSYAVRVGPLGRGSAMMRLELDTIRGTPVYHSTFKVDGSLLFFTVDDEYESWFDVRRMVSLRYRQQIDQGAYERNRTYEIFADRGVYVDPAHGEMPTVERPLDDGAFLYFLRTIPLEVGKTYTFNRYFKPDRNPVRVTVVRRERIKVPAGEFDAIVVQPKIKAKGIFAENANAEVWIQDDESRTVLQMKTHLQFGSVTFQLRSRDVLKDSVVQRD